MPEYKKIYEYSLLGINQQIEKNKKQLEILNFYMNCGLNTKEEVETQIKDIENLLEDLFELKDKVEKLLQ